MGKKKFIDKKKSATFHLLARDTSDPIYSEDPENDRVFVRVDNNYVSIHGLDEHDEDASDNGGFLNDPNSIFADAPEDVDYDGFSGQITDLVQSRTGSAPFPDHIRREILELGFPDDGYNYLLHLREIRNTGGGSAYYHNPKANLDDLPHDVKAYDASRVRISEASEDASPKTLYNVAEKSVNVRVQKAVDPEIARLLDENESEFGSDIEDLEEDFVVRANVTEEAEDIYSDEGLTSDSNIQEKACNISGSVNLLGAHTEVASSSIVEVNQSHNEKPRVQRLLDQQFDSLERREYGTDSDDDYDDVVAREEDIFLAEKLNNALKNQEIDDLEFDGIYKAPADILHDKDGIKDGKLVGSAADLIRRCAKYAEEYENADEDDRGVIIVEESSDESEVWDCETIISTYSNLDNHPGRIGAPGTRKKKLAETISGALRSGTENIISLGGKGRLPVDYLPHGKKTIKEKVKVVATTELPKRKPHAQESKEEKKERKAAVKEERREARRLKKETKGLYRDETKRAQKVAAVSGPSSIHLM